MLSLQKPFLANFLCPYNFSCDINFDNGVIFNFQILNPLHVAIFNREILLHNTSNMYDLCW